MAQSFDDWLNGGDKSAAASAPASASASATGAGAPSQPQSFDAWLGSSTQGSNAPAPSAPAAVPDNSAPAPQMGQLEAFVRAAGHHLMSPLNGAAQLVEHGVASGLNKVAPGSSVAQYAQSVSDSDDKALAQNEADYQKTVPDGVGTALGATIGSVAPFVAGPLVSGPRALVGAADAATASLPTVARVAAQGATRLGVGAGQGAAISALDPVTSQDPSQSFAQQKLGQIGSGAVGGAIGVPIGGAIGRVLSPVGNAAVDTLRQAGIRPTFGQLLGPTGSAYEQKLSSLPLVGDLINSARSRATSDFNRAIGNDALAPIGQTLPDNVGAGADMVSHVRDAIGQQYDNIARSGQVVMDSALQNNVTALQNGIATDAPSLAGRFNNIVQNQLTGKNGGNLTGDQWANSRSMINKAIRDHSGPNATSDDSQMVTYLNQLQDAITANAEQNSSSSVAQGLQQANTAYARYKALEKAAGTAAAQKSGNVFSPAQYLNATRSGQGAFQRATSSGGNGFPAQNLAQTAQPLLSNTVPDSGTAGRGMLGALLAVHNPALLAKGLLGSIPYLPGVRDALPALMTSRPGAVRAAGNVVRNAAPYAGGLLNQSNQTPDQSGGMLGQ